MLGNVLLDRRLAIVDRRCAELGLEALLVTRIDGKQPPRQRHGYLLLSVKFHAINSA